MCPQSAYPLLMPFFFDVTSCELLHESTIRQFTHGQGHGQDVTSQGSLGVYVKALSRSMCLAKNSKQSHLVSLKQWEYNLSSKPRFMHAVVNTIYAIAYRRLKSSGLQQGLRRVSEFSVLCAANPQLFHGLADIAEIFGVFWHKQ